MWTGSLTFGLVSVPVKMYTATEDHSVRFHQVHLADGGRIRMQRVCSADGREVPYAEVGKGFETPDGAVLVIDPKELEDLPKGPRKEIEVIEFVPSEQVDPVLLDRTYYLEPDARALKPYVLLRQSLQATERTAIVKIAIRQRTQLAALRVRGEVLVLQTMLWPDEVREPDFDFIGSAVDVRPQELQMAQMLIGNLSQDFDPAQYTDEYREAILQLLEAKSAGAGADGAPAPGGAGSGGTPVVDLMAALEASVARTSRAAPAAEVPAPRKPAAARKRAAPRKPAAKSA